MKLAKIATINPMMIIGAVFFILNRSNLLQKNFEICSMLFYNRVNYTQLLYQMNRIYPGYYSIISIIYRYLFKNSFLFWQQSILSAGMDCCTSYNLWRYIFNLFHLPPPFIYHNIVISLSHINPDKKSPSALKFTVLVREPVVVFKI